MPGSADCCTLMVVGDMHRFWRDEDRAFLESGHQDLAVFVGDLGDEDEQLVREVAGLRADKAVILGNHDAWQSFSRRAPTASLRNSLEVLGEDHLAYARRELPAAGLSMIGARPFSWGGEDLRSPELYHEFYGVRSHEESSDAIVELARDAHHRDLLILAHNGPMGLGSEPNDIWGKDFGKSPRGDWGDRDLKMAIDKIRSIGLNVRCVVAGHMHDQLLTPRGAQRTRFVRRRGTLYVNPAVVPRIRELDGDEVAYYLRMEWRGGELQALDELWIDADGEIRDCFQPHVVDIA